MFDAPRFHVRGMLTTAGTVCIWLGAFVVLGKLTRTSRADEGGIPPLRPIREVLAMPAEEFADGVTVHIRGIVTAVGGATCVQDANAGIWVRPAKRAPPAPPSAGNWTPAREVKLDVGRGVEVVGILRRGLYAPTLESTFVRQLGEEALPRPIPVELGRLFRGGDNAMRIEVGSASRAIVQGCRDNGVSWTLVLDVASRRIAVAVDKTLIRDRPDHLIDAEVRVVGVIGAVRNSRGEFVAPVMTVADARDLAVVKPAPSSPFESPRRPLNALATYQPEPSDGHRVWTEGVVTCVVPKQYCYLQDGLAGIRVDCPEAPKLQIGDRVRAAGFIDIRRGTAGLVEGILQQLDNEPPPAPVPISPSVVCARIAQAHATRVLPTPSDYDGVLIRFPATLVERQRTGDGWVITLTDDESTTVARLTDPTADEEPAISRLALGTTLSVTGVAQLGAAPAVEPLTTSRLPEPGDVEVLLRSAEDLMVVKAPSWWTPRRLAVTASVLAAVLAAAAVWVLLLRREVAIQSQKIADEQRSRHEAAVEFQATLRERNRLAANLHDTVLQTVTGIGYQLTACKADDGGLATDATRHFGLVERMVGHAVNQLRGTVWALRATSPSDRTLAEALHELAERLGSEHDAELLADIEEHLPTVPDFVAGNLLLIAQEAILNSLRHAEATTTRLGLRMAAGGGAMEMVIVDDGRGFDPANRPAARQGHFGLDGIRERVERIGGTLLIESRPGEGTTVTVRLPVARGQDGSPAPSDRTVALGVAD